MNKKRLLVAVSGGVDSVVLLDMLMRGVLIDSSAYPMSSSAREFLVVAHFDHGIRPDSSDDARFVEALAKKHGLSFEGQREELGPDASEALARQRRYAFLQAMARKHQAAIMTAHHRDDVVGTIAINLLRGTGWRGLAPFSAKGVERPLLDRTKNELYEYALQHQLEYVEDSTNHGDQYLRNRLRSRLATLPESSQQKLLELFYDQHQLRRDTEAAIEQIMEALDSKLTRSALRQCSDQEAAELLRRYIAEQSGVTLTWLAIKRGLKEVRWARAGTEHQLGQGVSIWLKKEDIIVGQTRPVV